MTKTGNARLMCEALQKTLGKNLNLIPNRQNTKRNCHPFGGGFFLFGNRIGMMYTYHRKNCGSMLANGFDKKYDLQGLGRFTLIK